MYEIMNRDSLIGAGARNHNNNNNHNSMTTGILPHRRGLPFNKNSIGENYNNSNNNNTDLFSRNRTSVSAASSDESDLQARLARLSVGSVKPAKSVLDDLLVSNEGGKNDYDWLLTPPGTPLFPSSDAKESQPTPITARSRSSVRSSSISKTTSRLSVSQSESGHPSRPARSSSVTRPSISTTQYTSYSSRNTNILNTSSASVSSYIRPSTPTNRSSTTTRSSTLSTRTTPSRGSTPSRTRPSPATTSNDRTTRPSQNTRPSTPGSRPQTPGNFNSPTIKTPSRPSTPTRRSLTPSLSPSTASLASGGRGLSSTPRSGGSTSRPSSPSPRVRPPPQPINHADLSHETPPNLRTTLPDRPLSVGRSRPGGSTTVKGNQEASNTGSITRRHSSPIVNRGRIAEPPSRGRPHGNGHVVESLEPRRSSHLPESLARKPIIKSSNSENGTGFGRNISKKSLDMAIKHMDIRNGGGRPISGSTLFPQSIRSSNSRPQPGRTSSAPGSVDGAISNGVGSENGNYGHGYSWNRGIPVEDQSPQSSKLSSEVDIYESSRYDAILLKEDLKNTSWLHSANDKTDEGLLFDHGFETLPEPFGPLRHI